MDEEDDPFGVFGEEDDESLEEGNQEVQNLTYSNVERARDLVTQANQRRISLGATPPRSGETTPWQPDSVTDPLLPVSSPPWRALESMVCNVSDFESLDLPWDKPLYRGPIQLCSSLPFGGGRGYVASQNLPAGSLVLLEEPLVAWSEGEARTVDLERIQTILLHDKAVAMVKAMEYFHPTRAMVNSTVGQSVPSDNPAQIEAMLEYYQNSINDDDLKLKTVLKIAAAKSVTNSDGTALSELDVLRLLVALRYNSLETGIYLHVAMFNHQDLPNCVKFRPTDRQSYSEVRTTRRVRAGETLTISYMPRLVSHNSRRKHLWDQHRFQTGELLDSHPLSTLETVGGNLPTSEEAEMIQNIEKATSELESHSRELAETAAMTRGFSEEEAETAKALELAALELCTTAEEILRNDKHITLLSCLALHLDACDLVQRQVALPSNLRSHLLSRLVVTGRKLATLQTQILGSEHFDLARTHLDVAQTVQGKQLQSLTARSLFRFDNDSHHGINIQ
jgi:hypothetical protein